MKRINIYELKELLLNLRPGTNIVAMASVTSPNLKPHPYGEIRKIAYVNGLLQASYENAVNKARKAEGVTEQFIAQPLRWGKWVKPNCPLLEYKGKYYLSVRPLKSRSYHFHYLDNKKFKMINKEKLKEYFKNHESPSQGVENEVIVRNYSLENIAAVKIGGEHYRIVN